MSLRRPGEGWQQHRGRLRHRGVRLAALHDLLAPCLRHSPLLPLRPHQGPVPQITKLTRQSILCSDGMTKYERLLRDCWETAERLLRDCWENAERMLRIWNVHCLKYFQFCLEVYASGGQQIPHVLLLMSFYSQLFSLCLDKNSTFFLKTSRSSCVLSDTNETII